MNATTIWTVLLASALCSTALAAFIDYRTGEIPNQLTFGTLGIGAAAHVALFGFMGSPKVSVLYLLGNVLAGAILCSCVPFALWRGGGLGGGDLKLFAALGGLLGLQRGIEVQLLSFVIAGLIVPTILAFQGKLWRTLTNSAQLMGNVFRRSADRVTIERSEMTEVRFGPAIFAGTLASACLHWLR